MAKVSTPLQVSREPIILPRKAKVKYQAETDDAERKSPDKPEKKLWNSLEITKICLSLLTPLMIFYFTTEVNKSNQQKESAEQTKRAFLDARGNAWKDISRYVIFIYKYFNGDRETVSAPSEAIKVVQRLDQEYITHAPRLDEEFKKIYEDFIAACFTKENKLRANASMLKPQYEVEKFRIWDSQWDQSFTGENNLDEITKKYYILVESINRPEL